MYHGRAGIHSTDVRELEEGGTILWGVGAVRLEEELVVVVGVMICKNCEGSEPA